MGTEHGGPAVAETTPTISVVIPVAAPAPFLGAALATIAAQRDPAVEVIVVDNGPDDSIPPVAASFASELDLRLVRQGRTGPGGARNAGLEVATGELVTFLDCDDLWPDRRLAVLREALEDPSVDLVFGTIQEFVDAGGAGSIDAEEATRRAGPPVAARLITAMLGRRAAIDRVGPFPSDLAVGEILQWIGAAENGGVSMARLDVPVLLRRIHGGNLGFRERDRYGDYAVALKRVLDQRRGDQLV